MDRYLSWSQFYSVIRVTTGDKIDPLTFGEIGSKKRPEEELADHFDGTCIDVFRDNLKLIQGACDVMGAECYIVKQATLATPDLPPDLKKNLVHTWLHEFNYETHLAAFDQIYRMIDDNFEDAVVIDATALSGKAEYFNDHVHLSEPGGDALGKLVADHIAGHSSKLD